jgi:UDP-glucose 4-epimerase
MSKRSVLVTGGAGFIGRHLCERLVYLGYDVVAIDNLSGGFKQNIPVGVTFHHVDCTDSHLVSNLFESHSFDFVYHFAAYAAEGLSHFIRAYNYTNNTVASMNIIDGCINHEVGRLVFASSIAVYGHPSRNPVTEVDLPTPCDPYGISKYAVELDLAAAHEMFGLDYRIVRPHNVYGAYQNIADRYRNVIGIFMNQVLKGEPLPVFGDGLQTRAFSYIDDVITDIVAVGNDSLSPYSRIFNVGSDRAYTIMELIQCLERVVGSRLPISHLPARNEVEHVAADHSLIRSVSNRTHDVELETGIRVMWEHVLEHGPKSQSVFNEIEVMKNLPPSWIIS